MKKSYFVALVLLLWVQGAISQCATSSMPTNDCSSYGDEIDAFTLNSIAASGVAGCSTNGYGFFNSPVWNLGIGNTYTFSAAVGSGTEDQGFAIWIDLNNDGFYGNNEMVWTASAAATAHTGSFTIPFSATSASNVAMRLRCSYNTAIAASDVCVNNLNTWGETQDFLVNITCPSGAPTLSVAASGTYVCSGTSVTMMASGAGSYTWTGGVSNGVAFTPTVTQTYTVYGGVSGCPSATATAVKTISVTSTPLPVSMVASPTVVCSGSTSTLTASGAANYTFLPSNQSGTVSTSIVNPTATTVFTVIGYSGSGCPGAATISLAANPLPTVTAAGSSSQICQGQSATLTATGALGYTWQPGGAGATIVVSPTTSTSYVVTGTNSFGCSASANTIIVVNQVLPMTTSASKTLSCVGGTVLLSAGGAQSYTWTNGPNTSSFMITPTSSAVYTVTGTNQQGCAVIGMITVNVFDPVIVLTPTAAAICAGSSATLIAGGATSYTWTGVGTFPQVVVNPTVTTSYVVLATGSASNVSCVSSGTVVVTVNPLPVVSASASRTVICRYESVKLSATGAGSYTWAVNGVVSPSISLTPTMVTTLTYSVTGEDSNGCLDGATVQVKVNSCTGISEEGSVSFVRVFPNPGKGVFSLISDRVAEVKVINGIGQVVAKFTTEGTGRIQHVDLGELSVGVYTLLAEGESAGKLVVID